MFSPVLLLKPQSTITLLLFSKNSTGLKFLNEYNTKPYHSHTTHFNPPNPCTYTSVAHHPTTSFNPILIHSYTTPPFCHLVTQISNRSIAVAVPPLWNKLPPALRQISESSYDLTQTSPLKISPRLFHSKLKTLLFGKS